MGRLHGARLLAGDDAAAVLLAEMREPDAVLGSEAVGRLIDFREPAAVLMTALLHFVSDEDDPAGIVARYVAPLAAGSFISLSHTTRDHKPPKAVEAMNEAGRPSPGGSYSRPRPLRLPILGRLALVSTFP